MSMVLQQALMKVCPGLTGQQALWSIFSLVGQLLHTMHIQDMLSNHPDDKFSAFEVSSAVDHIVAFTAAGVTAQIENKGERRNA